jgi:hypothetical protein
MAGKWREKWRENGGRNWTADFDRLLGGGGGGGRGEGGGKGRGVNKYRRTKY